MDKIRAYYGVGGVSPIESVRAILKEHGIEFDDWSGVSGKRSTVTFMKNIRDKDDVFTEAHAFIDKIKRLLKKTLWKKVDGGYTYVGVEIMKNNEWYEYHNKDGNDYVAWRDKMGGK